MQAFNIEWFRKKSRANKGDRYARRIKELQARNIYTESIEQAVGGALENIKKHATHSFVIYGEPQSGKTEMMIALTAKLLDHDYQIIVVLLNDSVQLLEQNLERFLRSGLDPAPKKFSDIMDPSVYVNRGRWVIFSKKNSSDLKKLLMKIEHIESKVVIDDEADFATPNAKVNKENEQTKINELVEKLLGDQGIYIGVTATPARLDLNKTFENDNEKWIDFPPHPLYTGQDVFFPTSDRGFNNLAFRLEAMPDAYDDPKYLREAFFCFLVNVAYLNMQVNTKPENYCMLIHTSGKKADHTEDYKQVIKLLNALRNDADRSYEPYLRDIYRIAGRQYPGHEESITEYIVENIDQNDIIVMNSDTDKKTVDYRRATEPATLFTIAIGGNIVSRGVTFNRLLSMFFTRDVKHKIQQDTYIQRARMFGNRGEYLKYFELHIPQKLYLDWQKCFVFHRLALSFIRSGKGSPVWLEDRRVSAAASSSIDKARVSLDRGEMSWGKFDYRDEIDYVLEDDSTTSERKLAGLSSLIGDDGLPEHVKQFIEEYSPFQEKSLAIHKTTTVGDNYKDADVDEITRTRGFISTSDLEKEKYPKAIHHIKIFKNNRNKARLFYKYAPEIGNIRFLKTRSTAGSIRP